MHEAIPHGLALGWLIQIQFEKLICSLFPKYKDHFVYFNGFSPEEFALYNLSIIVADSTRFSPNEGEFNELKKELQHFYVFGETSYGASVDIQNML